MSDWGSSKGYVGQNKKAKIDLSDNFITETISTIRNIRHLSSGIGDELTTQNSMLDSMTSNVSSLTSSIQQATSQGRKFIAKRTSPTCYGIIMALLFLLIVWLIF